MGSLIENELILATKVKRLPDEKIGSYAFRLAQKALSAPDSTWATLNEDTQEWVNTMASLAAAGHEFPGFPDEDIITPTATVAEDLLDLDDSSTKDELPKNVAGDLIRKLTFAYPEASKKDVKTMIEASGLSVSNSSLHTIFYETKATVKLLHNFGIVNRLDLSKKFADIAKTHG